MARDRTMTGAYCYGGCAQRNGGCHAATDCARRCTGKAVTTCRAAHVASGTGNKRRASTARAPPLGFDARLTCSVCGAAYAWFAQPCGWRPATRSGRQPYVRALGTARVPEVGGESRRALATSRGTCTQMLRGAWAQPRPQECASTGVAATKRHTTDVACGTTRAASTGMLCTVSPPDACRRKDAHTARRHAVGAECCGTAPPPPPHLPCTLR
eukprot:NODE_17343_length_948_cov_3.306943.p2 GENE.NODE_17343_length_948_cov_3.306943~~NODE_17343_length_948_cov_3.306943.p2  ORF type:complete len:213 (-),score=34.56 NODE_17343_length_948_cov_3.306943:4-642(-)